MEKGADIDLIHLRPKFAQAKEEAVEGRDREKHDLAAKAQGIVVIDSVAGRRIWGNIAALLTARIAKLIAEDPEAKALKDMLDSLGLEYNQAKLAVEAIQQRYTKDSP